MKELMVCFNYIYYYVSEFFLLIIIKKKINLLSLLKQIVRVKSKEIYDLITDETKLLNERSRLKTGMTKSLTSDAPKNLNDYDEDLEIRKAIENSKETLIQDEKRREMKRRYLKYTILL